MSKTVERIVMACGYLVGVVVGFVGTVVIRDLAGHYENSETDL